MQATCHYPSLPAPARPSGRFRRGFVCLLSPLLGPEPVIQAPSRLPTIAGMTQTITRGSLVGTFEGREGLTPYARWAAAFGLWPLWVLALLVVAWAALAARRR